MLYLNDEGVEFSGGEFIFADSKVWSHHGEESCRGEDVLVKPKCGTLVGFTGNEDNIHGVLRVTEGTRYAAAMWFTRLEDKTEDGYHEWPGITGIREVVEEEVKEEAKVTVSRVFEPAAESPDGYWTP